MIKRYWVNLITSGFNDIKDTNFLQKVIVINTLSLLGIISLLTFGTVHLFYSNFLIGFFELSCGVIGILNLIQLRITSNIKLASILMLIFMIGIHIFLLITGGLSKTGIFWIFTYPPLAFFLTGKREGVLWSIFLFLAIITIIVFSQLRVIKKMPYSIVTIRQIFFSLLVLSLMIFFYEKVRSADNRLIQKQKQDMVIRNKQLINEINEKKKTAQELSKYKENLEKLVEERTMELVKSNVQLIKAKDQAEAASRSKSVFLTNISHELKTPLTAIIGFSKILLKYQDENLNEKQLEEIDLINKSANRLLSLINDLLDLSKIDSGKMKVNLHPFSLNEFLLSQEKFVKTIIGEKDINFQIKKSVSLPEMVISDLNKLNKIFKNILGNAVKFTDTGAINLIIEIKNNFIFFEVNDTGIGINTEEIEIIFDEFKQVDDSLSRKYGGAGLGLALAKKLLNLLKGDIEAESEISQGSKVRFYIPLKKEIS